jgi:hypothetical protein
MIFCSMNMQHDSAQQQAIKHAPPSIPPLLPALLQTSLEELSLQNVGCSIFACKAVEELTAACASLRMLHLFNNMSDNAGAQHVAAILARSPNMQDFRMASSRVGPQGGIALAKSLSVSEWPAGAQAGAVGW